MWFITALASPLMSHRELLRVIQVHLLRLWDFSRRATNNNYTSSKSMEGRKKVDLSAQLAPISHFLLRLTPWRANSPALPHCFIQIPGGHWGNQILHLQDGIPSRSASQRSDSVQLSSGCEVHGSWSPGVSNWGALQRAHDFPLRCDPRD